MSKAHRWMFLFLTVLLTFQARADVWTTLNNDEEFNNPKENRLSFFFYRAPKKIDWSSPGALVRTAIWNTLTGDRNPISHIDALISCTGERSVLTGMSSIKNKSLYLDILFGQKSLELLTDSYPGALISEEEIRRDAPYYASLDRVRTLSIKVSPSACKRVLAFVTEYRKRDYGKIYAGFTANPFKGQGAGCAAFGMSLLKVAGLLENEFIQKWSHRLLIPRHLMNYAGSRAKANFWDFMVFGLNGVWGKDGADSVSIVGFDPELMYNWVAQVAKAPQLWDATARAVKSGLSLGIEVDRSQRPAPEDDYWTYTWPPP